MPYSGDLPPGRPRPGRGGAFKPLVPSREARTLYGVIADTPAELWLDAIGRTLDSGAALLLSPTSDGGAFSITLLDGDERSRSYCATNDEVVACLQALLAHCDADRPAGTSVPAGQQKPLERH